MLCKTCKMQNRKIGGNASENADMPLRPSSEAEVAVAM